MAEQSALQPQFISEVPQHLQVREGGPEVPELTKPQLISFTVEEVKSMLVEINGVVSKQDENQWRIDSESNLPRGLRLCDEALVIRNNDTVEAGWQIVNTVRGTDGLPDRVVVQALNPGEEGGTLTKVYSLGFFMEMQLEIAERIEAEQDSVKKAEFSSEQGYCRPITEGMRAAAAAAVRSAVEAAPPDDIELMRKEATNLVAKFASDPDHKYIANLEKQHARLTRELEANWKANYDDDPGDAYKARISNKLQRERGPIYQRMTKHPDYESYQDDKRKLAQLQAAIEEASR